jgi:hypothetical protein
MGYGKKAARNIDKRLMGSRRWSRLFPEFDYSREAPEETSECRRNHPQEVPALVRVRTMNEVVTGLTPDQGMEEALRCLRCDVKTAGGR